MYRTFDGTGRIDRDIVALESEAPAGVPLLELVMHDGRRCSPAESLATLRQRSARSLAALPPAAARLAEPVPVVATISAGIRALAAQVDAGGG